MTAAFVGQTETWPAGSTFDLCVGETDGDHSVFPNRDGSADICVYETLKPGETTRLVHTFSFPTVGKARAAAVVLANAFAAIREFCGEIPSECVEHDAELFFLDRETVKHWICVRCGTHLGTVTLKELRDQGIA